MSEVELMWLCFIVPFAGYFVLLGGWLLLVVFRR